MVISHRSLRVLWTLQTDNWVPIRIDWVQGESTNFCFLKTRFRSSTTFFYFSPDLLLHQPRPSSSSTATLLLHALLPPFFSDILDPELALFDYEHFYPEGTIMLMDIHIQKPIILNFLFWQCDDFVTFNGLKPLNQTNL